MQLAVTRGEHLWVLIYECTEQCTHKVAKNRPGYIYTAVIILPNIGKEEPIRLCLSYFSKTIIFIMTLQE